MSDLQKFIKEECHRDPEFKRLWTDPEEQAAVTYGMALCLARESMGLSIKQLARRVRATPQQLTDMELDVRAVPSEILIRVLHVLNIAHRTQARPAENNVALARRLAPDLPDRLKPATVNGK